MKKLILFLALLGGFAFNSRATVSGPDNIVYGTITLGGSTIVAADTNYFVAARLQANGPAIATYTMGSLPRAGNYYSLRVSVESVGQTLAPNAVTAGQLIYVDVDDQTGIRAQTTLRVGTPGQITLLNFGNATFTGSAGSLTVTILPTAAASAGAEWQVDGGSMQNSGAIVTNLSPGSHLVTFTAVSGWSAPPSQIAVISTGVTTPVSGIYSQPTAGLTLITNGYGSITHSKWPNPLVVGNTYKVIAAPNAKNIFVSWVGGVSQPYSVLSTATTFTFTMTSNLLLEANFMTNVFMTEGGTYRGLFAPTNSARAQNNSGAFQFAINSSGTVSGSLFMGAQTLPFSGAFASDGTATMATKATTKSPAVNIALQLDYASQSVSGVVSNNSFTAEIDGNRDVFGGVNKAAAYAGQYTFVIPGTTNPAAGPFGISVGTVKVSLGGAITLGGSLADGSAISQSSMVSGNGYWPLYVKLYGGKGSLWGWNYFANHTLTAPSSLSWINTTNAIRSAPYRTGFTNQGVNFTGSAYSPNTVLAGNLTATLQGINPAFDVTIPNLAANTNDLMLKYNKSNGAITGTVANPLNPAQTLKISAVIVAGQTNAQGYILETNQSGTFILDTP